eukprot:6202073-Pleurochrysis_carterae.AAC.1
MRIQRASHLSTSRQGRNSRPATQAASQQSTPPLSQSAALARGVGLAASLAEPAMSAALLVRLQRWRR